MVKDTWPVIVFFGGEGRGEGIDYDVFNFFLVPGRKRNLVKTFCFFARSGSGGVHFCWKLRCRYLGGWVGVVVCHCSWQ